MKTIPSAMAVAAVALLVFVIGCGNGSAQSASVRQVSTAAGEGVPCPKEDVPNKATVVYVDVQYAPDGTPSASPDQCYITSGTTIVWRDPPDRTTAFNLVFGDKLTNTREGKLAAARAATGYQLSAVITGQKGQSFKYGIQANGKTVDPAVIIKKSQ